MAASRAARVVAFERDIKVATADLEPAAINALLARTAREAVASAVQAGEGTPTYRRFVNGVADVQEELVKAPGPILYLFNGLPEIVGFILDFLRDRSPKLSGRYRESHFAAVGGRPVDPLEIPLGAEVVITNPQPYARKIEVGSMKGMRVPPGVYEAGAQWARSKFGGLINVQRQFVTLAAGAYLLRQNTGRKNRQAGDAVTYPALIITSKFE